VSSDVIDLIAREGRVARYRWREIPSRVIERLVAHEDFASLPAAARAEITGRLANASTNALHDPMASVFEWADAARRVRNAKIGTVSGVSEQEHTIAVVPYPDGPVRLKMRDLVARLIDTPSLGIDVAVVADWARTGWNVRRPQVIIEAGGVGAGDTFEQTVGRAQRAPKGWTHDMSELVMGITGFPGFPEELLGGLGPAARKRVAELAAAQEPRAKLTTAQLEMLAEAWSITHDGEGLPAWAANGRMRGLSKEQRFELAQAVIFAFGKVTNHITLLKYRDGSGTNDVRVGEDGDLIRKERARAQLRQRSGPDPVSGGFVSGPEQAPIVNPDGSRAIGRKMSTERLTEGMQHIVQAWFDALEEMQAQPA
jgi:hypothetical protein